VAAWSRMYTSFVGAFPAGAIGIATGRHLLIPQGSRLIGRYDSRVAYGQDGVQVAWSR
jgi:type IV secretion system protein TrbI